MNYNVYDIAEAFLSKEPMTHKKLQKLCYYADVLCLALYNEKILEGNFEAWIHGPVNRKLFNKYKDNGRAIINIDVEKQLENKKYQKIIDFTWDIYGQFSADELEDLTHSEIAWNKARNGYLPNQPCKNIIDFRLMQKDGERVIKFIEEKILK